jgi:hypothetical protein
MEKTGIYIQSVSVYSNGSPVVLPTEVKTKQLENGKWFAGLFVKGKLKPIAIAEGETEDNALVALNQKLD